MQRDLCSAVHKKLINKKTNSRLIELLYIDKAGLKL